MNPNLGPGTHNYYSSSFAGAGERRANTASFVSNRKDLLFGGNSNPGPQDYTI